MYVLVLKIHTYIHFVLENTHFIAGGAHYVNLI
jgi:hypothetical protein